MEGIGQTGVACSPLTSQIQVIIEGKKSVVECFYHDPCNVLMCGSEGVFGQEFVSLGENMSYLLFLCVFRFFFSGFLFLSCVCV